MTQPASLFRSLHLSLVAIAIIAAAVATVTALFIVDRAVTSIARVDIEAEYQELARYQSDFKIVSVADAISFRVSLDSQSATVYLLARNDGSLVVGSFAVWPEALPQQEGWYRFKSPDGADALAKVTLFAGEFPVAVGRKLAVYDALKSQFLPWMVGLILGLIVALVAVVLRGNTVVRRRIAHINQVLRRTSEGHLDARVEAEETDRRDELATLAQQVNRALDENSRLLLSLDAVSQTAAHEINKELSRLRDLAVASGQPALADSADGLLRLLGEILELSKIKSSSGAQMAPLDMAAAVEAAVALYQDAFDDAGVRLLSQTMSAPVLGQFNLLTNAAANLLNNALRHSPPGGQVSIAVLRRGSSVVLVVEDQGPGTPSEELHDVLERSRQGQVAGHGFGLRFVQAVSIRHGGKLQLKNMEQGLRVSLTLPVNTQPSAPGGIEPK